MDVKLKEVCVDNFSEVVGIELEKEQERFVPSSCYLVAKSKYHPNHQLRAIQYNDTVVGLVLYQTGDGDFEPHEVEIFGLMIDRRYQKMGIGKIALNLLVKEIKATNQFTWIELSCDPENRLAESVYRKSGFQNTHVKADGCNVWSIET